MNLFLRSIVFVVAASAIVDVSCPRGAMFDKIELLVKKHYLTVAQRTICPNPHVQYRETQDGITIWNHVMRILSEVYVATAPGHEYVTLQALLVGGGVQEINVPVNPDFDIYRAAEKAVAVALTQLQDAPNFNYVIIFTPNERDASLREVSVAYSFPYLVHDEETLARYRLGAPARRAVAAPAPLPVEGDDADVDAERRAAWDPGLRHRAPHVERDDHAVNAERRAPVHADEAEVENAYGCPSCSIL